MIAIDIFKGNHRFSEQTRHPGLDSVVGAANLAPGRHCRRTRITTRQKAGEELSWQIFMSSTRGEDNDGQLWYSSNDNINWTSDAQVQNVGMSESPSAVLWADGISVFHQGARTTPDRFGTTISMAQTGTEIHSFRTWVCRAHPRRSSTTACFMSSTRGPITTDSFGTRLTMAQSGPQIRKFRT